MTTRRDLAAVSRRPGRGRHSDVDPLCFPVLRHDLARRIEQAEVDLISATNAAARRRGAPGFSDLGRRRHRELRRPRIAVQQGDRPRLRRRPQPAELDPIERAFAAHGAPTQVELAHLADPAIGELLTARGYRLESFENVLGRSLDGTETPVPLPASTSPERRRRVRHLARGHGGRCRPAGHPRSPLARGVPARDLRGGDARRCRGRVRRYAAVRGGSLAGGAELRLVDGIAQFAGAATSPPIVVTGSRTRSCRCAWLTPPPRGATWP